MAVPNTAFTYSQNFNTLEISGTPAWSNNTTLSGWFLFRQPASSPVAITTYIASTGGSNSGSFYSYGNAASTDRALGGLGSGGAYFGSPAAGAVAGWIAVAFTNNTGSTINSINISFDGEQWRNGGNTDAQTMVLEYGIGATFGAVATWTAPGGNFDWTSPVTGASGTGIDGNVAGLVSNRGGTLNMLNWANGATLWIRWIELNDPGNDHGLAIDNFSFSINAAMSGTASQLTFFGVPATVVEGETFNIQVCATDGNMAVATDYATTINLVQNMGLNSATIMPMPMIDPTGGCVTYMITPGAGDDVIQFLAASGSINNPPLLTGFSPTIQVTDPKLAIADDCSVLVDFNGFTGSGFTPNPAAGQLSSFHWAATGFSDGNLDFGGTRTTGDFARGTTAGGVNTGGIYALNYTDAANQANTALWIQPAGTDFTPGSITLRVCNNSGATIPSLGIGFDFIVLNDQDRSQSFDLGYSFMYSMDGTGFTPLVDAMTPGPRDEMAELMVLHQGACIPNANLADGECIFLRWESDDIDGMGNRDEFGIDNIRVCPAPVLEAEVAAACTDDDERFKYNIVVSSIAGGLGAPYTVEVDGEETPYEGGELVLGPFDHSLLDGGNGGVVKQVIIRDASGIPFKVSVAEVVCGYPQDSAFCDCDEDGEVCEDAEDEECRLNAGAILSQAAPGTFEVDHAFQEYILTQGGNILQVNKTGLFFNLPNGNYSVYAINFCKDDEDAIRPFLAVGQPIQPLIDNVGVDAEDGLGSLCYTICGPADYRVGCTILAEDVTWTLPSCSRGETLYYNFNLLGTICATDDLDLDLLDIDFGDLEDNLIDNPNARLASQLPVPRTEATGDNVTFVEYALEITPDDAGIYPVTIRFNGASVTIRIQILVREPETDYRNLSCNAEVNVRLDENCEVELKASQ
ncbi:MAG TPA: hypothetical protein PKC76_03915, partial [Saprospiraceae bacterium]|nr:hypothetical protein [Saprospiraceae bacterium]HMP23249.1 hypothetical protein [Saprospiraceae bacterium]